MPLKAVIIDTNEKATAPWITMIDFGVPTLYQSLPCGDCWLATDKHTVIVERKTPSDLLASIADGRLFEQCTAMIAQSPWCYVCVTGYYTVKAHQIVIERQATQWNDRSVEGALLTVQELGVNIIRCDGETDYGPTMLWLANRDREEVQVKPRRKAREQTTQETILCSLPGISDVRAAALLEQHKSLAQALVGLTKLDTDEHTPGIGRGTRQAVRAAMQLAQNEELLIARGHLMEMVLGNDEGHVLVDQLGFECISKMAEKIQDGKTDE